ncbi:hypothetical protein QI0055_535 [Listeria monocytogenes]|uniref:Uncharacterized protein n=1 Tax=Listeria innocua ATCC 33091 TaxID=1002366 RepID=A0AB72ZAG1_LISIO|nr:hypothetical protein LMOh7858_0486 [Listeria monocytogenes str. 4b H7858] [Listeria monocytogenes serotype 4b str. H7858]EFR85753.1 hypothetical protein NT04LM_0836 [Listeria monocytogenes FSL F2-208]EHN61827.1 hypothetical protein HMPREF0557_01079 [Listeria innocua ATCC 33091]CAE6324759.1 hypothetical protein QI0055_535 [Listeria monocytogenes]CAE6408000.1 hypothetical protein QI0054_534 [Listeria monocytogenes]
MIRKYIPIKKYAFTETLIDVSLLDVRVEQVLMKNKQKMSPPFL